MSLIEKFSPDDVVDKRYELEIKVHEGRWGDIYRANDKLNDQPVAIRFFPIGDDGPADFDRFEAHARELSGMTAPSLALPLDQGLAEDIPYLVSPWVPGQNLRDRLAGRGALGRQKTITVLEAVLDALDRAHQSRMTHGLLRPVKVVADDLDDDDPMVKVVDFQIWRFYEWASGDDAFEEGNLSRRIVRYTSPEVLDEHRVKPTTDIYALGLLAIELLTGSPAFDDNDRVALIGRQLSDESPPIADDADAGVAFRGFLEKLTSKDERERFRTAGKAKKAFDTDRDTFLSEPAAEPEPPQGQSSDEPPEVPKSSGAEPSAVLSTPDDDAGDSDDESDAGDESNHTQVAAGPMASGFDDELELGDEDRDGVDEISTADDAEDELFEGNPGAMRSLSDGAPLDESSEADDEDDFLGHDNVDFGDYYDDDEVNDGLDIDDDFEPDFAAVAEDDDSSSSPSSPTDDGDDEEFSPELADDIPDVNSGDKILGGTGSAAGQGTDSNVVPGSEMPQQQSPSSPGTTSSSPAARPPARPASGASAGAGSDISLPAAAAIIVALMGILGVASYVLIFQTDDPDLDESPEVVEQEDEVELHSIRITTSPPALTVLVEGHGREVSPRNLEIAGDEFPLRIQARMGGDNIQERTLEEPIEEIVFEFED